MPTHNGSPFMMAVFLAYSHKAVKFSTVSLNRSRVNDLLNKGTDIEVTVRIIRTTIRISMKVNPDSLRLFVLVILPVIDIISASFKSVGPSRKKIIVFNVVIAGASVYIFIAPGIFGHFFKIGAVPVYGSGRR